MNLKTQVDTHTSQISRLEQAMTALAEAQVKTADETRAMRRAIAALAKAQAKTEAALAALAEAQTARQWQAYLTAVHPKQCPL